MQKSRSGSEKSARRERLLSCSPPTHQGHLRGDRPMRRLLAIIACTFLLISSPSILHAQNQSSMTGVVTDASGALVPDTTVVLSNPHTAVSFTQTTDSKGSYRFTNIPPGQGYQANFSHQGFATTQLSNLDLEVGVTRTQDAKLQAGAAQTIEVT